MITWTDERVEQLIKLNDAGFSASLIARQIGSTTRCAVLGKLLRLGLSKKRPTQKQKYARKVVRYPVKHAPNFAKRPAIECVPLPPPKVDDIARVSFADLEPHHCRFIPGEPTSGYCGLQKVPGTSYCAGHLHRCHTDVGLTAQMAAHERAAGEQTAVAAAQEFLEPA